MPAVFAKITNVRDGMSEVIANVLETRATIPSQKEMTQDYASDIPFSSCCLGSGSELRYRTGL